MSASDGKSVLRRVRDDIGFSREMVVRRPELEPQITTKTLERWENDPAKVQRYRLEQLAAIYGVTVNDLLNGQVAA